MVKHKILNIRGTEVVFYSKEGNDYVSLTDIARVKNSLEPKDIVKNWMRSR